MLPASLLPCSAELGDHRDPPRFRMTLAFWSAALLRRFGRRAKMVAVGSVKLCLRNPPRHRLRLLPKAAQQRRTPKRKRRKGRLHYA